MLGSDGAKPVSRQDLLRAAFGRADAVADAEAPVPVVSDVQTHPLGDRMALATVTWRFGDVPLVSDFLLERTDDGLRCVAYLPRTNVLDHLA